MNVHAQYYMIFHIMVETFGAVIAFAVYMVSKNTYNISKNDFFRCFGKGYFYVGLFDLFHAFAYPSFKLFPKASLNLIYQFWIASRYIEFLVITGAIIILYKNYKVNMCRYFFSVISAILFIIIYFTDFFPKCYIEGKGMTYFKIISEYLMVVGYVISLMLFNYVKGKIDEDLFRYLNLSLVFGFFSEIFIFTFILQVYSVLVIGHILKVMSFYFMYKGIIVTGLQKPVTVLYRTVGDMNNQLIDVSYKLNKEKKLRQYMQDLFDENEKYYEFIVDNCSDGIVIIQKGKFVFANKAAIKIFGAEKENDLIGRNAIDFVIDNEKEKALKRMKELIKNKANIPLAEYKIITLDNRHIYLEVVSSFIIYRGKPSQITILKDITSSKRINELEKDIVENKRQIEEIQYFNNLLKEFFTNISHELKTPLNVLLGAIQVMERKIKCNVNDYCSCGLDADNYLKIMKQNCYRLLRLVNNLLDLTKIDTGYSKLNLKNCNIVSIVEDITLSISKYTENKGINLVFDTDIEEKYMAVDVDKIERIMLNLLSNAVKFTDEGGEILVSIKDLDDNVLISVKDTGIGIPYDKQQVIFERFGQVERTLTRNKEGCGIGLSIVKSLVNMHGGNITLNSKEGEGSEFIITLPVKIIKEEKVVENRCENKVEKINIEFSDIYCD